MEGIELSFTKLTLRDPVRRRVVSLSLGRSLNPVVDLRTTKTPLPFDELHALAVL